MLKSTHIWFGILFCLLLTFSKCYSQPDHLSKTLLQVKDGLCDNRTNCIFQDSKGLLWFGTQKGLSKYDGYDFSNYLKKRLDSNSISGNDITAITEDNFGNIWVGTISNGLNRFDKKTNKFTRFLKSDFNENSINGSSVWDLHCDKNSILWIATNNGISKYDIKRNHFINFSNSDSLHKISMKSVFCISEDMNGNIWLGGSISKLCKFDKGTQKLITYSILLDTSDMINDTYIDKSGIIWIGTNNGYLIRFNPQDASSQYLSDSEGNPKRLTYSIYSISQDNLNNLWIGCFGTLIIVNPSTLEYSYYDKHKSENSRVNEVQSDLFANILQDRSGVIWLATRKGILKLTEKISDHFKHSNNNSVSSNYITSFTQDSSGMIWIGTDSGLNSFNPNTKEFNCYMNSSNGNAVLLNNINSLLYDSKHQLWIGTEGVDLTRFDLRTKKFHNYGSKYKSSNLVFQIYEDKNNEIWTISKQRIIARFDQKNKSFHNDTLPEDYYVTKMIMDRYGYYWFATFYGRGLWRLNPKDDSWKKHIHNEFDTNSLCEGTIYTIHEDHNSNLWIGTDNGLNKITISENGLSTTFTRFDNIHPNNSVYEINEDSQGRLWLQIMHGIALYNENLQTVKYYNEFLPPGTGDEGRVFISDDDKLYIAGTNGFVVFNTESYSDYVPPILLTRFQVNKTDRYELINAKEINLEYDENSISCEFIAVDYTEPMLNQYAYWLEGVDSSWIYSATRRYVNYTNLEPGNYILHLKASNCFGKWNEAGINIPIVITPPFWETLWYYMAVIIFFASLLSITIFVNRRSESKNTLAISFMTILTLLVIFEFVNVTIEPYIEGVAAGVPVFKILLNLLIAGLFFPLEKLFIRKLKSKSTIEKTDTNNNVH